MKRVLVNENAVQAGLAVNETKETAAILNAKLIPALETIGIEITDEILRDCLDGASQTRKNYSDAVARDIKNTRTPSIRLQMLKAADEAWEYFEQELFNIRREARNYQFLTVEGGKCTLNPENEEKLRDNSRLYITDPKEIEAFRLHLEITEKLNQLFKGRVPYRWFSIFSEVAGNIVRNDETDYTKIA